MHPTCKLKSWSPIPCFFFFLLVPPYIKSSNTREKFWMSTGNFATKNMKRESPIEDVSLWTIWMRSWNRRWCKEVKIWGNRVELEPRVHCKENSSWTKIGWKFWMVWYCEIALWTLTSLTCRGTVWLASKSNAALSKQFKFLQLL